MDKLAKRAGVTALVLIASAGTALGFGLIKMASSLDTASGSGSQMAPPRAVAAITLPDVVITTFEGETPLVAAPQAAAAAPSPPTAKPSLAKRLQPAPTPLRIATAVEAPTEAKAAELPSTTLDSLDVGLGTRERERGLDDHGSKAFSIRQTSGAEPLRKPTSGGERITFETDLGRPDR